MSVDQLDELVTKFNKRKNNNIIPGQTFRLPSLGKLYKDGELSPEVINGEVIVHPMNTLDEICLKTPDMLFQGSAVEQVISRRVPQVIKPLKLLPKDVDYLLSAIRQVTYGDELNISFTCTKCGEKHNNIKTKVSGFLNKSKTIDDVDPEKFSFDLDGFYFTIKFSTYDELIKLNQNSANNSLNSPEELYDMFIDNLSLNIESIDSITDKDTIHKFLYSQVDTVFQYKLLDHIQDINDWGIEFKQAFSCKKCNHINNIPIAINPVSFFSLPSDQEI